jgi:hypothetical protein
MQITDIHPLGQRITGPAKCKVEHSLHTLLVTSKLSFNNRDADPGRIGSSPKFGEFGFGTSRRLGAQESVPRKSSRQIAAQ